MGHRVYIGYQTGTAGRKPGVRASYCHWGLPEDIACVLLEHYNTPETAKQLVEAGDRSTVDIAPETRVYDDSEPVRVFTLEEFCGITEASNEEYAFAEYTYLFGADNMWQVAERGRKSLLDGTGTLPDGSPGEPLAQVAETHGYKPEQNGGM